MIVYEFGHRFPKVFAMFTCTAEPWWSFEKAAMALARDYHVCLFIPDGHDEMDTEFISIEKNVEDTAQWLKKKGITHLSGLYGLSMGGASAIRFLATTDISVDKVIIDGGITPYPYPRWICRLIALLDFASVSLATRNLALMKLAAPPRRFTPKGEDTEEHYRKILEFTKKHYSYRTIYNVFWSANNYSLPKQAPRVASQMEYWYGELEKGSRKRDIAFTCQYFPQTVTREFKDLAHGELVMMDPERFYDEVRRFMEQGQVLPQGEDT